MPNQLHPHPPPPFDPNFGPICLAINTFSYEERRVIFPAVAAALEICGCWLLDRRPLSFTQVEFCFDLPVCGIVDLYAGLIAAGLELTRESHKDLAVLCTLQKHGPNPSALPAVVTVTLRVRFLEDIDIGLGMSTGLAQA